MAWRLGLTARRASKFALEALHKSLLQEIKSFGIRVTLLAQELGAGEGNRTLVFSLEVSGFP